MSWNSSAMLSQLSVNSTFFTPLSVKSATTHFAKLTLESVFKICLRGSITAFSGHLRHSSLQHQKFLAQ